MFAKFGQKRWKWASLGIVLVLVAGIVLALPGRGQAHCDSEQGPVAMAAQKALDTNDVKLVLPYVKPESEAELTGAFKQTMEVRQSGGKARELADKYFQEVAVRLHRAGEGAPYTGLKDEPIPAAIQAADKAMASGSLTAVSSFLNTSIQAGLKEKFEAVVKAREEVEKLGTTAAHRERVEAELQFEKYVYELYSTATAENPHAEGAVPQHGAEH